MNHSPETTGTPNIYELQPETQEALLALSFSEALPPPTLTDGHLDSELMDTYRQELYDKVPGIEGLHAAMSEALAFDRDARGYLLIDGVPLGSDPDKMTMTIPSALNTLVGTPFAPASKLGFWQNLGVKLDAVPYRFQGTGENMLHIDCVNTTLPPDYFSFYGFRPDPAGGGMNVVSNLQTMVEALSTDEIDYLKVPRYSEGQFDGMVGVGEEYDPFPVLTEREDGLWLVRYTAKMLPGMEATEGVDKYDVQLFRKIEALLKAQQERLLVKGGQLLIANQVILAHGRDPLGPHQESYPPSKRRFLRQSYIRAEDNQVWTPAQDN